MPIEFKIKQNYILIFSALLQVISFKKIIKFKSYIINPMYLIFKNVNFQKNEVQELGFVLFCFL